MPENKVQFNIKNVHYALLTEQQDGSYAFGTPVHVPGAVRLNLNPVGDLVKEYADGIVYWKSATNNGYDGDLEMERLIDRMMEDIWGFSKGASSGVITENASVEPHNFALLFQIDGDAEHEFYALYSCMGTRPAVGGETNTETKTPQHQTSTITASPLADGRVMSRTTADTPASVKAGWFSSVYVEGGAGAYVVEYNANGGTGKVVDGNSPYAAGSTAKAMYATGLTGPDSKTFSKWSTDPAGGSGGTEYDPGDSITVDSNVTLYAIWA